MTIGERILEFWLKNKSKYKTKKIFAEALQMSPEQLYLYTSNRRKPGPDILENFSRLGCDIHWLVTGRTFDELSSLYNSLIRAKNINDAVAASFGEHPGREEIVEKLKAKNAKIDTLIKELLDDIKTLL